MVAFLTGYAEAALVEKGMLPAGLDVIAKPFYANTLAARVRGMLNE